MTKLYIDTNIIIDAVENRCNVFGRNIGNPAADLFSEAISCKYYLIVSSWAMEELVGLGKLDSTKMFFLLAKKKILKIASIPCLKH
jgi:rRNA-processing protein FCF1